MPRRVLFAIVCLATLLVGTPAAGAPQKPFTVVIDAGHGGKDPGAIGKISREKDLNLDVALLTGRLIQEKYPAVKVVFTRSTDVFLPLQQRADIVNSNNADLFICIHTNSAASAAAQGVETFVLGTEKMDQNLDVAMRENAVIKLEDDYQTAYQGFDPNSIDSYIMFELMQNVYMEQSLRFATLVQRQFVEKLHRAERGVRQAAFWVLLKSACPSILLEMGFISNREEEKYLASDKGKREMAQSLCNAFGQFYSHAAHAPVEAPAEADLPAVDASETPQKAEPGQPRYAVQILASRVPIDPADERFHGLRCECLQTDGWYKYYYGASADRDKVVEAQAEVRKHFPDCWIITLEN